jgi:hypothetical protein
MNARWYLTLSCIVSGASASHRLGTRSLSAEIRKIDKAWIVCLPPGPIRGKRLRSLDWPTGIPEFAERVSTAGKKKEWSGCLCKHPDHPKLNERTTFVQINEE